MGPTRYLYLKQLVIEAGYGKDIDWSENIQPCKYPFVFFMEAVWVILNSGMKNQIAERIWHKFDRVKLESFPAYASSIIKHKGKCKAAEYIWRYRISLFIDYKNKKTNEEKIEFLESLPWIGPVTKYHLAKNLGIDVCKPDRHLVRIADMYGITPEDMCETLSIATGDRIATVDYVIWRAANLGKI